MKALLALVAGFALVVALAAVFVPSPAATVAGVGISKVTLDDDLSEIANSPTYSCYLSEEGLNTLSGAGVAATSTGGDGVYSTTFADDWLRGLVLNQLRARLLARRGLTVSNADLTLGRDALKRQIQSALESYASESGAPSAGCGGSGSAVLTSMPASFVDEESMATADSAVLAANAVGTDLSSSGLADYYGAHQADFDKLCYGLLEFKTKTLADAASAAITAGTSFTAESTAIQATTASAKTQEATSGCGQLSGTTPAPLAGAIGQTVGPVEESTTLYLIVQVTSRSTVKLSPTVRGLLITSIISAGAASVTKGLKAEIKDTSLVIDPRYGSVSVKSTGLISPPSSPPPSSLLSTTANEPGASSLG